MTHKNAGKYTRDEVMMKPTTILPESHDASDGADDGGNFMLNTNDDNADDDGDADEHA